MCLIVAIYDRLSLFPQEGFGYVQKESSFHPHVSVVDEETENHDWIRPLNRKEHIRIICLSSDDCIGVINYRTVSFSKGFAGFVHILL